MAPIRTLLLASCLLSAVPALPAPLPARLAQALPPSVARADLQGLLQRFINRVYLRGFRHLGDERDFDHGHFLYNSESRPVAVLYHTQELAFDHDQDSDFGYIDPQGRNWLQWIDGDRIENAAKYLRRDYPRSAAWDWFRELELPALKQRHTILDKMLDPDLVPYDVSKSRQVVFTRVPCDAQSDTTEASGVRVLLPTGERVCLALSQY